MSIVAKPSPGKRDYPTAIADLVKAIAGAVSIVLTANGLAVGQATAAALPSLIDMTLSLAKRKDASLSLVSSFA